jgi:hypothetical protein
MTTTYGPLVNITAVNTVYDAGSWVLNQITPGSFTGIDSLATVNGATCTFTFTGTEVVLYILTAPDQGTFTVQLDGGSVIPLTAYSASAVVRVPIYDSGVISAGSHTLLITRTARATAYELLSFASSPSDALPDAPSPIVVDDYASVTATHWSRGVVYV